MDRHTDGPPTTPSYQLIHSLVCMNVTWMELESLAWLAQSDTPRPLMDSHWSSRAHGHGHGHGHAASGSRPVVARATSGSSVRPSPTPTPSPSPPPAAAPRALDDHSFTSARRASGDARTAAVAAATAGGGMAGSGRKRSDSAHSRRRSSAGPASRVSVLDLSSASASPSRGSATLSHASLMRQREQLSRLPLAMSMQSSNYTPNFNRITSMPVYGANSITGQAPQHRWTATPTHTFASAAAIAAASTPARAAHATGAATNASSASRSRASSAQPHSRSVTASQSRTQAQSRDNDADGQSRSSSGFSWPISVSLHGCANVAARELIEALISKHKLQAASEQTATLLWTDQKQARSYKSFRTIANTSAWFNGPRAAALAAANRADKASKAQPYSGATSAGASSSSCDRDRPPPVRLTNHLPDMHTCVTKSNLGRALTEFQQLFPAEFDFFPTSWDLLHPAQARDFQARLEENRHAAAASAAANGAGPHSRAQQTYILKPHAGRQGEGIVLVQRWAEVVALQQANPGRHYVASEYISDPLLLDGYKFDCRVYVLVQSLQPLRLTLFRDGLARLATAKYVPPSAANLHNHFLHLTNYSLNKHNTEEFQRAPERAAADWNAVEDENNLSELAQIRASKRSIRTALLQLRLQGVPIVIDEFWTQVAAIVDKTMLALWPELQGSYLRHFADRVNVDGPASTTSAGGSSGVVRAAQPSARNGATAPASRPVSAMPRTATAAGVGPSSRASPSPVASPSPSRSPCFSPALSSSPSPCAASPSPLSGRFSPRSHSPLDRESGSDSDSDADSSPRSEGSRRRGGSASRSDSGASTPERSAQHRASRPGSTAPRSPPASFKPASAWGGVSPASRRSSTANWTNSNTVVQSAVRSARDDRHASASPAPASKTANATATTMAAAAATATLSSHPVAAASTYPALSVPPALLEPAAPSHAFHLLGFDILIDANLKAHLLEVNAAPSMNLDSGLDKRIKLAVLERSFEIMGLIPPPPSKAEQLRGERANLFDPSCDAPDGEEESDDEAEEIEAGGAKNNGGSSSVIARPTLYKHVSYGSSSGSGSGGGSSTIDPPLSAHELQHARMIRAVQRRYQVQDLCYTLLEPDRSRRALFPFGAARVQKMFLTFSAKRFCSGLSVGAWNRLLSAYGILQRAPASAAGAGGVAGASGGSGGSSSAANSTGASQPDLLFMRITRARNERLMSFSSFCQALLALAALRHPHVSAIDAFHMLVADVERRVRHREAERAARAARAEAARKAASGQSVLDLDEDDEDEPGEVPKRSNTAAPAAVPSGTTASHSSSPSLTSSPLHSPALAPRRTVSGISGGSALRDMSSPHGSPKSSAAHSLHLSGGRSASAGSGGARAPSVGPALSSSLLSSVNAAMHLAASHTHAHAHAHAHHQSHHRPFSSDHHRGRTHALHAAALSTTAAVPAAAAVMAVPAGVDRPYVAHLDDVPRARNASSNGYTNNSYLRRAF